MPAASDFRLYHSNALDVLAGILAELLRRPAPGASLLEPEVVLIPQPAMRRWLQATLAQGRDWTCASIDALFALMAQLSDTNVYHRGGAVGAALVRARSAAFLAAGGSARAGWQQQALDCHHAFVAQRLSPGGAADLLAAACLLHQVGLLDGERG